MCRYRNPADFINEAAILKALETTKEHAKDPVRVRPALTRFASHTPHSAPSAPCPSPACPHLPSPMVYGIGMIASYFCPKPFDGGQCTFYHLTSGLPPLPRPPFVPLQVREILAKAKETAFVVEHAPMEDDVKSEFVQVRHAGTEVSRNKGTVVHMCEEQS